VRLSSATLSVLALFIGIDSGTQSTKAVVLDLEARRVIADARAPHQLIDGLPVGHMEQHPADSTKSSARSSPASDRPPRR
jgi:sugar (pentulose or hexulose) kinase